MNKFIGIIICVVLLTGCSGMFNVVKKDTVMVKKTTSAQEKSEVEYEGVLTADTVKTLSLNAVHKYFGVELAKEEVQIELMTIDQNKLQDMLDIIILKFERGSEINTKTELAKIPNGLFEIMLTQIANPEEVYYFILNAQSGDVLKASKGESNLYSLEQGAEQAETLEIANQFIREKGSYALSDLTMTWQVKRGEFIREYYYMNKDTKALSYSVVVNEKTEQVIGMNKDLMAILNYFP